MSGPRSPGGPAPVVVVGAGIAGVACARALVDAGLPVRVLDRGRRIGGRMASRRLEGRPVDLGASYVTVSDDRFADVVRRWADAGTARPWTRSFAVRSDGRDEGRKEGPLRWGAARGLRSLVEDLARDLPVEARGVTRVERSRDGLRVDGEPAAAAAVLAMPDPQAARLLGPGLDTVRDRLDRAWEPILALAARWSRRAWPADLEGAFVNGDPAIAFVADDGRRRGDGAPVLVTHSTGDLAAAHAAAHADAPTEAESAMLEALRSLLDLPAPAATHLHRWSLARPLGERREPYLLDSGPESRPDAGLVGVCGDGWGAQPKVEGAWLSGTALGEAVAQRLT